jgi:prephenate dehydrogenase
MSIQLTIIGLGQIGASIGLALNEKKNILNRVGHDKNPEASREAQKKGAVDKIMFNLPASVEEAKIVVLCLPVGEVIPTLEVIVQDLPEGSVVMDTALAKRETVLWAQEHMPAGRYYVGLYPSIRMEYLHSASTGSEAAKADLFKDSVIMLDAPRGTDEAAIQLASDFIRMLGAIPLFTSMDEADGLMASAHILPQLVSAALLRATVDQPGWRETLKMTGRSYAMATAGLNGEDEVKSLGPAITQNRTNVLRVLDNMLISLEDLRASLSNGDANEVANQFDKDRKNRERWWDNRLQAGYDNKGTEKVELPSFGERMKQAVIGKRGKSKNP